VLVLDPLDDRRGCSLLEAGGLSVRGELLIKALVDEEVKGPVPSYLAVPQEAQHTRGYRVPREWPSAGKTCGVRRNGNVTYGPVYSKM
jgi:hypothetical protein